MICSVDPKLILTTHVPLYSLGSLDARFLTEDTYRFREALRGSYKSVDMETVRNSHSCRIVIHNSHSWGKAVRDR